MVTTARIPGRLIEKWSEDEFRIDPALLRQIAQRQGILFDDSHDEPAGSHEAYFDRETGDLIIVQELFS